MNEQKQKSGMRMSVPCVGGQHHQLAAAMGVGLSKGDEVALIREPNNQYDKNAIKVLWQKGIEEDDEESQPIVLQLGYVAKNFAADLSWHMDKGMRVKGVVQLIREKGCMIDVEEVANG